MISFFTMTQNNPNHKGFTLIELLVVIAILAILSVVVILTLNPSQLLKQSRDSQRVYDMSTFRKAITLYITDVGSPSIGSVNTCYGSSIATPGASGCGGRMTANTVVTTTAALAASTTGAGWIPINFASLSIGAPIGSLPLDPTNNATYFYSYATNASIQFEINANMESTRYSASGTNDMESNDGGNNATVYELGTNLTL